MNLWSWCGVISCTCGVTKRGKNNIIWIFQLYCQLECQVYCPQRLTNTCRIISNQEIDYPHRTQLCGERTQASRVTLSADPPLDCWGHHLTGLQGRHSLLYISVLLVYYILVFSILVIHNFLKRKVASIRQYNIKIWNPHL